MYNIQCINKCDIEDLIISLYVVTHPLKSYWVLNSADRLLICAGYCVSTFAGYI